MATLAALKRQLAKLEADVARKTKEELSGAISKVRSIMSEFGVTIEHLTSAAGKKASTKAASKGAASKKAAKPSAKKAASKRAGAGVPKYRDPKTGVTWTGMGKPPSWLAGAKSRDAFLIDASAAQGTALKAPKATKAPAAKKAASAKKSASTKKAATKTSAKPAKKAVKAVARKAGGKAVIAKKRAPSKSVPVPVSEPAKKTLPSKSVPKKTPPKKASGPKAAAAVETAPQQSAAA